MARQLKFDVMQLLLLPDIQSLHSPLSLFLLQAIIIIVVARVLGHIFKLAGQPAVLGEMVAGILLGPTLLGTVLPSVSGFLFPTASLGRLDILSQLSLILFMFIVGIELDTQQIKKQSKPTVAISLASIVLPFTLGILTSYFFLKPQIPQGVSFIVFAVFMGIAMSITAFPVLVRIMQERKIMNTPLGAIALSSAAVNDVVGWCLLAAIVTIAKAGPGIGVLSSLLLSVVYICIMLFVVRPVLKNYKQDNYSTGSFFVIALLLVFCSAYVSELIGIHALFGAFLAGVVTPVNHKLREYIISKLMEISTFFLPIFFVMTGLKTQISLIGEEGMLAVALGVISVAVIGKFAGSAIAGIWAGQSVKNSLSIGALMNTRGLMELVVLNVGFDLGIISAPIFTIMVIMAICTTLMTSPLLNLINRYVKA